MTLALHPFAYWSARVLGFLLDPLILGSLIVIGYLVYRWTRRKPR